MENKSEQNQMLNKRTAFRRVHYSHPMAAHKVYQGGTIALLDGDLDERQKLVKSAPLLSRRSKVSVSGSLTNEPHGKKAASSRRDENGNNLISSLNQKDLLAQDMVMSTDFDAKKANENSSAIDRSRKNYTKQLMRKGKPTLLTALQINRYNTGGDSKQTAINAKERPLVILRQDFNKFNLGMRGTPPKYEPTTLMFQQWGIRKCTRSGSGKSCSSWAKNRLNFEAWPQSVYAFKYKPIHGELKNKKSAADCMKDVKATPLPPNTSPSHSYSSHNGKAEGIKGEFGKITTPRKSDNKGNEVKVEIILSPPKEERAEDLNKEGMEEIDENCLSPSVESFFRKDCEPAPSKVSGQATAILQDIEISNGSNKSLALGETIETIREDNTGGRSPCLEV